MNKRVVLISAAIVVGTSMSLETRWVPLSFTDPAPDRVFAGNHAFVHFTGSRDPAGWGAYYRHHVPGYLVAGLKSGGEVLPDGTYRYDFFFVRRLGHLPSLMSSANEVVRVEAYDHATGEVVAERTYPLTDFSPQNGKARRKSLIFSTWGRAGDPIEPRVYWKGMAGIALNKVERVNLGTPSAANLQEKSELFARQMREDFTDHGYVVVKNEIGQPSDLADAAIWTGIYAASLAMRYKVTQEESARRDLEKHLWALHRLYSAAPVPGILVRYVDSGGIPLQQAASKDTYTGFYYGVAQGLPYIQDAKLRDALLQDVRNLTEHFLKSDLTFPSPYGHALDLRPGLSKTMMQEALGDLREKPALRRQWIRLLQLARGYYWMHWQRPPKGFDRAIRYLKANEIDQLEKESIPILNDIRLGMKKLQTNVHRSALAGSRLGLTDTPYIKLDLLLLRTLKNLDDVSHGRPFTNLEDIKVFPSQSIHALHFIKVAAETLPKPNPFEDYYRANLYEGKALLRTAAQWHQIDEDFLSAFVGETEANTLRTSSSHLSYLALYDLIQLEKDPLIRFKYQKLFETQYRPMRADGNAMIDAMHAAVGLSAKQLGLAWWSLDRYPVDRLGKGPDFWRESKAELVAAFGGETHRQARDPLPPDLRPRDAFIWQRSARSIYGDEKDWRYPPLDYLFAYWLARSAASLAAVPEKS